MFRLTAESVDTIIRAMEDKTRQSMVDPSSGRIVPPATVEGALPLPPWTATDGFRLMARFVQALEGHPAAVELAEALTAERGVYRRFKDAVGAHPGLERRWRSFHDRAMGAVVKAWYEEARATLAPGLADDEDLLADIDAALCDFSVKAVGLERILALMASFPALHPLADPALPAELAALLVADLAAQARMAQVEGSALFLEALLPSEGEESTAGFLVARTVKLSAGRTGLVILHCAVGADLEDCGVEELLRDEACTIAEATACLELRRHSGKATDEGWWSVGSLLMPPLS